MPQEVRVYLCLCVGVWVFAVHATQTCSYTQGRHFEDHSIGLKSKYVKSFQIKVLWKILLNF